ncbi:MAG: hypothetical protein AAF593_04880 [Planctomycetota bacterium]
MKVLRFVFGLTALQCLVACGNPDPLSGQTPQHALAEFHEITGVNFPSKVTVLGYSRGWDEGYLKIEIGDDELAPLLPQTSIQPVAYKPDYIDGMNPMGIDGWWQPHQITKFIAYEGALSGNRNHFGKVAIVVSQDQGAPLIAYIYFFKT